MEMKRTWHRKDERGKKTTAKNGGTKISQCWFQCDRIPSRNEQYVGHPPCITYSKKKWSPPTCYCALLSEMPHRHSGESTPSTLLESLPHMCCALAHISSKGIILKSTPFSHTPTHQTQTRFFMLMVLLALQHQTGFFNLLIVVVRVLVQRNSSLTAWLMVLMNIYSSSTSARRTSWNYRFLVRLELISRKLLADVLVGAQTK